MLENHHSRSDDTFRAALFLSVLIHLVAILYLKPPELTEPMEGKVALSVILAKPQETSQPMAEPAPPIVTPVAQPLPEMLPLPATELPAKHEKVLPPKNVPKPMHESRVESMPGETPQETPADPVKFSPQIVEAGKVQALLLVDEGGRVRQIIWKELPALTDETLQQIEQQLRARTYLATGKSYTLYEIVEMPRSEMQE